MALISTYKKSLPLLYNRLSKAELEEARACIQNILDTGSTYGNPNSARLVQIVNNFWLDPSSGTQVSLPHDLFYFNYDIEYIDSLLKR